NSGSTYTLVTYPHLRSNFPGRGTLDTICRYAFAISRAPLSATQTDQLPLIDDSLRNSAKSSRNSRYDCRPDATSSGEKSHRSRASSALASAVAWRMRKSMLSDDMVSVLFGAQASARR